MCLRLVLNHDPPALCSISHFKVESSVRSCLEGPGDFPDPDQERVR
jgi:hypothetical protein